MTATSTSDGRRSVIERLLLVLASLMPWHRQADAAHRWVTSVRAAGPRERSLFLTRAVREVVTSDRTASTHPGLAHAIALGRLRVAAAFAVLLLGACAVQWVFGGAALLAVASAILGTAAAGAAVALLALSRSALGPRGRLLLVGTAGSLGVLVPASLVSAATVSGALLVSALSGVAVAICALIALSWSMHLGPARGDHGEPPRLLAASLGLAAIGTSSVITLVIVRPLAAAPGVSLPSIYAAVDASGGGPWLYTVNGVWVALVAAGIVGTHIALVNLARRGALRASSARAIVAAVGVGIVVSEWFVAFGTVQAVSDIFYLPSVEWAVTAALGVVGVCLAAYALLEGARHPWASVRTPAT